MKVWRDREHDSTFRYVFAWYPTRMTQRYSGSWPGKYTWIWLRQVVQSFCINRGKWYAYSDIQYLAREF